MGWPCPACSTAVPDDVGTAPPARHRPPSCVDPAVGRAAGVCTECRSAAPLAPPRMVRARAALAAIPPRSAGDRRGRRADARGRRRRNGEIPAELEALEALESIARARGDLSGGKSRRGEAGEGGGRVPACRLRAPASRAMLGRVGTTMQSQALNGRVVGFHTPAGSGIGATLSPPARSAGPLQHARAAAEPHATLQVPAPLLFRTREATGYHQSPAPRPTQLVTRGEPRIGEIQLFTPRPIRDGRRGCSRAPASASAPRTGRGARGTRSPIL